MQIKELLLDKRVIRRALDKGLLNKAQYQKMLDELPDVSHKVAQKDAHAAQATSQGASSYDDSLDDDDLDDDDLDDEGEDQAS